MLARVSMPPPSDDHPPSPPGPVPAAPPGASGEALPPPDVPPHPPGAPALGAVSSNRGLRLASIVLAWMATASLFVLLIVVLNRRTVFADLVDDGDLFTLRGLVRLDDADSAVAGGIGLFALSALPLTIVVSLWTLRFVGNAQVRGAADVSPGLACGGWYIPVGQLAVPFVQLRRSARHVDAPRGAIGWWQAGFAVLVAGFLAIVVAGDFEIGDSVGDVESKLDTQTIAAGIALLGGLVSAVAMSVGLRRLDTATGSA